MAATNVQMHRFAASSRKRTTTGEPIFLCCDRVAERETWKERIAPVLAGGVRFDMVILFAKSGAQTETAHGTAYTRAYTHPEKLRGQVRPDGTTQNFTNSLQNQVLSMWVPLRGTWVQRAQSWCKRGALPLRQAPNKF